jgi:hypothetical protein
MRNWTKLLALATVFSISSTAFAQTIPADIPVAGWALVVVWFFAMARLLFGIDVFGNFGN